MRLQHLGTVLLRMAVATGDRDALIQGISKLERTRTFPRWDIRDHPFATLFNGLIRFAEEWGIGNVPDRARSAWTTWFLDAQSSPNFSHVGRRGLLGDWQRRWLTCAVKTDPDVSSDV